MAARFRIDQSGPGLGVLDRTRTDLVEDEVIDLVVPSPVMGATYSWEILYKFGSTAALTEETGTSTSIGPGDAVVPFCAFLIQLTETIGPTSTTRKRVAAVRGTNRGFRPLVFGETANPNSSSATRNADDSTDNEERTNIDGVIGDNSQSWTGWIEALNQALFSLEGFDFPLQVVIDTIEGFDRVKVVGAHIYSIAQLEPGFFPSDADDGSGMLFTGPQNGATHLYYWGSNSPGLVCLTDGSIGLQGALFSVSDTVFPGMFARFDLSGGNCTATLKDGTLPGSTCVVKIEGAATGNSLNIVDGSAQNIDGVSTYTLSTDNAFARLTKMENGSWAVG